MCDVFFVVLVAVGVKLVPNLYLFLLCAIWLGSRWFLFSYLCNSSFVAVQSQKTTHISGPLSSFILNICTAWCLLYTASSRRPNWVYCSGDFLYERSCYAIICTFAFIWAFLLPQHRSLSRSFDWFQQGKTAEFAQITDPQCTQSCKPLVWKLKLNTQHLFWFAKVLITQISSLNFDLCFDFWIYIGKNLARFSQFVLFSKVISYHQLH